MNIFSKFLIGSEGFNVASTPTDTTSINGDIWYNSTLNRFRKQEDSKVLDLDAPIGRTRTNKGVPVASTGNMTLGKDGNVFHITGTTTISGIIYDDWQEGDHITLIFDGVLNFRHLAPTAGAGTSKMFLKAQANLITAANTTVHLVFDGIGSYWYEI